MSYSCGKPECNDDPKTIEECITCLKNGNGNGCHLKYILKNLIERIEELEGA